MEERIVKNNSLLGLVVLIAAVVLLAGPASASGSVTYNSWSNTSYLGTASLGADSGFSQEFSLTEQDMYVWGVGGVNIGSGQTVTGATITINDISNWSGNSDELFMHLLDSATNLNAVTGMAWTNNSNEPNPPFIDHFLPAYYPTTAGGYPTNLVPTLIQQPDNNTLLNDGSYTYTALNVGGVVGPGLPSNFSLNNIDFNQYSGNGSGANQEVGGNFVYTLSAADLTALNADIANGNTFALGFDPDCHFFNNGISISLTYGPTGTGTPEPATLTLFALGLAGVLRKRFAK
jgi:hypothetical protein